MRAEAACHCWRIWPSPLDVDQIECPVPRLRPHRGCDSRCVHSALLKQWLRILLSQIRVSLSTCGMFVLVRIMPSKLLLSVRIDVIFQLFALVCINVCGAGVDMFGKQSLKIEDL
jgi:hypothetical protein